MSEKVLKEKIENYWEEKDSLNFTDNDLRSDVNKVLNLLDNGQLRVSEKKNGTWEANQWVKKAITSHLKLKIIQFFLVEPLI